MEDGTAIPPDRENTGTDSFPARRCRDRSRQNDQCEHVGQYHQLIQQVLELPHEIAFHHRAAEDQRHCHNRIDRCQTFSHKIYVIYTVL